MRCVVLGSAFAAAFVSLTTLPVLAEVLTVNSILTAQKAGAPTGGIVAMVNDPTNTVGMSAGDLVTLRDAGVSEKVIAAVWARVPAPTPTPVPLAPDDARLVDVARLVRAGTSESIVAEQVRRDERPYVLTVNDLVYLKQNGVGESTIGALMATRAEAPALAEFEAAPGAPAENLTPAAQSFDSLVLKTSFMTKNRPGRLDIRGDSLVWTDGNDPKKNFEFKTTGLEKVWFTCQARSPENFCYQINFKIVKGARYRFQDFNRESGSNAAVLRVMDALRTYFPQLAYGAPEI